ncbi:hypothetical protein C1H46_043683 [Malus baccata]|uniref:Uncharacterized protein n=1 Tax=Malus baccata TaxID=106549 RepID=A0A540K974_MALBA|nr:hypothetical protein C1H46_043683 [Malus baccata]
MTNRKKPNFQNQTPRRVLEPILLHTFDPGRPPLGAQSLGRCSSSLLSSRSRYSKTPQEMQQKVKMAPPNKDEPPSRRVSIFSPSWGISVGVKTIDLSKLILKEFKKKKHEQWRMKNALAEMITATTPHIIQTYKKVQQIRKKINRNHTIFLDKFYKHHTSLKLKKLKHRIKSSSSNWRKSVAMDKLSNLKLHNENVKHQVKTNGWQPWH